MTDKELERCDLCGKRFPCELINAMECFDGTDYGVVEACPICGLEIRNWLFELPEGTPFESETAQKMYGRAQKYLEVQDA